MKIWEPKPPGTLWATPVLLRETFTFTLRYREHSRHTPPAVSCSYDT